MADLNDWQTMMRFVRDNEATSEPVSLSPEQARRLALAAKNSLKIIVDCVAAVNKLRGMPPPRVGTYEENYGEPDPDRRTPVETREQ